MRKRHTFLIVLISVTTMLIGILYARLAISPKYTSHIKLYVENSGDGINGQNMVSSSLIFLEDNEVLQAVTQGTAGKYTLEQIRDMVKAEQIEDSLFVQISATAPLPEDAQNICNLMAAQGELVIEELTGLQNIKIVGAAATPVKPSTWGMTECGILGFAIGLVISTLAIQLPVLLTKKVKGRKSILENFDIPFFGEVPSFDILGKDANG